MSNKLIAVALVLFCMGATAQNTPNYTEQGGARTVIGGELDVVSGGALKIAGTTVTATAADLNAAGSSNDLLDVTPGTVEASKAVVVGATKNVDVLAIEDLKLGAGAGTSVTATAAELNAAADGQVIVADQPVALPISGWTTTDGVPLVATETAGAHNLAPGSAGVYFLLGEVADNETEVSKSRQAIMLPANYVAGQNVVLRFSAVIWDGEDTGAASFVDAQAFKAGMAEAYAGDLGADIVATAQQDLGGDTVIYDFTITGTTLAPGDLLIVEFTTSVKDDAGGTTAAAAVLNPQLRMPMYR